MPIPEAHHPSSDPHSSPTEAHYDNPIPHNYETDCVALTHFDGVGYYAERPSQHPTTNQQHPRPLYHPVIYCMRTPYSSTTV